MSSDSLYLEIGSYAKVWARTLPPEVKLALGAELCLFARRASKPPADSDIVISPLGSGPRATASTAQMDSLYGFSLAEEEGHLSIVFTHKGVPDIVIRLSTPITLYYSDRLGVARKLYGALLYCLDLVLGAKGVLFGHGGAVEQDGRCILFAGHRGSRKTQLLIALLKQGWNYVSDDKFILDNGTLHLFQPFIYINDWHFETFPWLKNTVNEGAGVAGLLGFRQRARSFAMRHVYRRLLPLTDRFLNPSIKLDVATAFPSSRILLTAGMSTLVFLKNGDSLACSPLTREEAVREMTLVQRLASADFAGLDPMLAYYGRPGTDVADVVRKNLGGQDFFSVSLPEPFAPFKTSEGILRCLQRV